MADPASFFALPEGVQRAHVEHVRNHIIGRYTPAQERAPSAQGASANPQTLHHINTWRRQQQQRKNPR